jgi:hypothetical protein
MAMVNIIGDCYAALENMKRELAEQKRKNKQTTRTTFSECICLLLRQTGRLT